MEAVKPTDHSDKELRIGGIDDYRSAMEIANSQIGGKPKTGTVPSPLFGTAPVEEEVDA